MRYTNNPAWLRLDRERVALLRIADRTADQQQRIAELAAGMRQIEATAPDGYALPKIAADLIAHAEAHGWLTGVWWNEDSGGSPFVDLQVARRDRAWHYKLTWQNRYLPPGRLRYARGIASTPRQAGWVPAPSVKAIREVIAANPVGLSEEAA